MNRLLVFKIPPPPIWIFCCIFPAITHLKFACRNQHHRCAIFTYDAFRNSPPWMIRPETPFLHRHCVQSSRKLRKTEKSINRRKWLRYFCTSWSHLSLPVGDEDNLCTSGCLCPTASPSGNSIYSDTEKQNVQELLPLHFFFPPHHSLGLINPNLTCPHATGNFSTGSTAAGPLRPAKMAAHH